MGADVADILGALGLTLIVTKSYLFTGVRERASKVNRYLGKLLECPLCFGFWAYLVTTSLDLVGLCIINTCFIVSMAAYLMHLIIKPFSDKYD